MHRRLALVAVVPLVTAISGCAHPHVRVVDAFEAAKDGGDLDAARAHLADDPRVWWGERAGPGSPWTLEDGRWESWDEHFNGETTRLSAWRVEDDRVWADMREVNDYYRLTDRSVGRWRRTYFFDAHDRIEGTMIAPVDDPPEVTDRFEEFEEWARIHHPRELEYLMPDGNIDPTGDRAPRFRALLNEWRAAIGLHAID